MIPAKIHFFWHDLKNIPGWVVSNIRTWEKYHDVYIHDARVVPDNILGLKPNEQSDVARWWLLWSLGGVYSDVDTICLRPLNDLLWTSSGFAVLQHSYVLPRTNAFVGAECRSGIIYGLYQEAIEWSKNKNRKIDDILRSQQKHLMSMQDQLAAEYCPQQTTTVPPIVTPLAYCYHQNKRSFR